MRLADKILRQPILWQWTDSMTEWARERVRCGPVVVVDNVTEYLYASSAKDVWHWRSDFPNVAPPFDSFFVETRRPSVIRTERAVFSSDGASPLWGACVTAQKHSAAELKSLEIATPFDPNGEFGWVLAITPILTLSGGVLAGFPPHIFGVDADGRIATETPMLLCERAPEGDVQRSVYGAIYPVLLAMSFMHCRNVRSTENSPDVKLSKKHERRHGLPLLKFHTLEIEPMKRVVRDEGKAAGASTLQQALHICRGHFKTYDEKPLFGRTKGTFWWPSTVRGSVDAGVVSKDYAVKPPREES